MISFNYEATLVSRSLSTGEILFLRRVLSCPDGEPYSPVFKKEKNSPAR